RTSCVQSSQCTNLLQPRNCCTSHRLSHTRHQRRHKRQQFSIVQRSSAVHLVHENRQYIHVVKDVANQLGHQRQTHSPIHQTTRFRWEHERPRIESTHVKLFHHLRHPHTAIPVILFPQRLQFRCHKVIQV